MSTPIPTIEPGWGSGLCQCCSCDRQGEVSICCCGTFCPCVLAGFNQDAIDGEGCCRGCMVCALTWPCPCVAGAGVRRRIRFRYGITDGSCCSDVMSHCPFVVCCAQCQEAREIQFRAFEVKMSPANVYAVFSLWHGHMPEEHPCCCGAEQPLAAVNIEAHCIQASSAVPSALVSGHQRTPGAWS